LVRLIYLPATPDGRKQGLDDFLAAGNGEAELLALASDTLRAMPADAGAAARPVHYRSTPNGLEWLKPTRDGQAATPLTNFAARVVADRVVDDGAEPQRRLEVEASFGGRARRFGVSAAGFASLGWVVQELGAGALVYPGQGIRDHAQVAIRLLSGEVPER